MNREEIEKVDKALKYANEYKEYLDYVDSLIDNNDTRIYRLPLKAFNSKHLYLVFLNFFQNKLKKV